jgi:DNA modification methylase
MPESVRDRPTKAHEYLFLLSKSQGYYYDADAIREKGNPSTLAANPRYAKLAPDAPYECNSASADKGVARGLYKKLTYFTGTRNKRSVWMVATQPSPYAHFATFPEKLIEPCILAGSAEGDYVFDPFVGSGTTVRVAEKFNRKGVGLDLTYHDIAQIRTNNIQRVLVGFG